MCKILQGTVAMQQKNGDGSALTGRGAGMQDKGPLRAGIRADRSRHTGREGTDHDDIR